MKWIEINKKTSLPTDKPLLMYHPRENKFTVFRFIQYAAGTEMWQADCACSWKSSINFLDENIVGDYSHYTIIENLPKKPE